MEIDTTVKEAKRRCEAMLGTVETLRLSPSCKHTLLRLIHSELAFLSRFSSNDPASSEPSMCPNIGHLEAVAHILQQPCVSAVSRVCKTIPTPPSTQKGPHVDIVCTFDANPVWFIVSARNPKHISWHMHANRESSKNKPLQARVHLLVDAARHLSSLKPISIIFFFSNGLDPFTHEKFLTEFRAVDVGSKSYFSNLKSRSYQHASVVEIKVDHPYPLISNEPLVGHGHPVKQKPDDVDLDGSFGALVSEMMSATNDCLINFDTTALIAIVSGISNGGARKLLHTSEDEMKSRFKGNYEFVVGQAMSETESPIHTDIREGIIGKKCIVCESVFLEFNELVKMCAGPNERRRARDVLKCVVVVPDGPSERVMGLPTTRKLALKNKVVFGTGDCWHAPTLSANTGFVRAVLQTGMSLFTIEHRPRALTGD